MLTLGYLLRRIFFRTATFRIRQIAKYILGTPGTIVAYTKSTSVCLAKMEFITTVDLNIVKIFTRI
jgi:hypothetical protein